MSTPGRDADAQPGVPQGTDLSRSDKGVQVIYKKDITIRFPGVNLHGTFIGFLGCVYFLFGG